MGIINPCYPSPTGNTYLTVWLVPHGIIPPSSSATFLIVCHLLIVQHPPLSTI